MNQQAVKWIVIIAALAGVAIWQSGAFKGGTPSSPKVAQQQPLLSADDEALTAKLQPFIECINRVDSPLRGKAAEYREFLQQYRERQADPEGTRLNRTPSFGGFKLKPFETDNEFSKDCIKAIASGIAMKPVDAALDQPGQSYATALEKLLPLMNAATAYYRQEDYKDDKLKKGKELDAQLSPLLDQLFAASSQIRQTVHAYNDGLHERELAAMEKQGGKTYEWHTLNVMFQTRRAVEMIGNAADSGTLKEVVQQAEQKVQMAMDDATAHAQAHPNEKTPRGNKPLWFDIDGNASAFLKSIKDLRRAISDKETDSNITDRLNQVNDDFNSLVRTYNMVSKNRG